MTFRFVLMWLEDKHLFGVIKKWWGRFFVTDWAGFRFSSKLKKLKCNLKVWSINHFAVMEIIKAKLLLAVQSLDSKEESQQLSANEFAKKIQLKESFNCNGNKDCSIGGLMKETRIPSAFMA